MRTGQPHSRPPRVPKHDAQGDLPCSSECQGCRAEREQIEAIEARLRLERAARREPR